MLPEGFRFHQFDTNIVKELLFCPYCKNVIKNELHFLFVCPLHKDTRGKLLDTNFDTNPCLKIFNALMSCGNEEVVKRTTMYLFDAFEERQTMFNE